MNKMRYLFGLLLMVIVLCWGIQQQLGAAPAEKPGKAKSAASATTATPAAEPTPAPAPQKAKAQANNQNGPCTVNGKTFNPCPPGLQKQANRQAVRQAAPRQSKGVAVTFAGLSPATVSISPLASTTALGSGATLALPAPTAPPDYFGVGNYANSPLPVVCTGFSPPDPAACSGLPAGSLLTGTGMRKFVDALPGLCGTNYSSTPPTANPGMNGLGQCIPVARPDTSGLRFAGDATAGLSDFYRIAISEYSPQMHSDIPPTRLRGYADLVAGGTQQYLGPLIIATRNKAVRVLFTNNLPTGGGLQVPVDTTYMGAGSVTASGQAAKASSPQRAVLHLHGGATPWISDGTPHQWITPSGGDGQPAALGYAKGLSFQNVPDMLSLVPNASSLTDGMGTYYWTNQQSGRLMFYHEHAYGTTRLGVYNGAAAGYLLVDPAEETALAANTAPGTITGTPDLGHMIPLVIQDKTFVPSLAQLAAQDPTWSYGTNAAFGGNGNGDLWFPHVYTPNQNPADLTGANGFGRWDWGPWFWPPQNQSTLDLQSYACTSSATPAGGWAFPPLMCPGVPDPTRAAPSNSPSGTPEAFMDTPVVNGTAYPTMTVDPTAYRFHVLNAANDRSLNLGLYVAEPVTLSPIITNPGANYTAPVLTFNCSGAAGIAVLGSGTFNGVAFINGVVGITMTSQPAAGCTGPTVTIADVVGGLGAKAAASLVMSTNTEVKMVPAVPVGSRPATLPNCSQLNDMYGGGQVTAILDATGNPINNTGLPAACWPMYNSLFGFTAGSMGESGQLSWANSDSRIGGVPDPTTAGPPIIQVGAEGGLLPQVAVIPSTPVSYDYNKRSITVLNVLNHGLWLGPAERADIIIDFSKFAGQTLIFYNDAPAPVPAGDPRLDYFTNDPDMSSSGGAPSTIAGYGPNTRTIMQIKVNSGTGGSFNLKTLTNAIPGIFAATQDDVIVPEPVYPAGHGYGPTTYIPIQATSVNAWIGGPVGAVALSAPNNGGTGYIAVPTVTIGPPTLTTGTQATATAALTPTSVAAVNLVAGGSGYTSAPTVTVSGGGGSGATATATLAPTSVASATVTNRGSGYTGIPTVTFSAPQTVGGVTATGTAVVSNRRVTSITINVHGSGYTTPPTINITGGGGSGAQATPVMAPTSVGNITGGGGSGYTSTPTVSFSGGGGSGASGAAVLTPTSVASLTLTNPGNGYTGAPTIVIDPPITGTQATAIATAPAVPLKPKAIQELFTLDYGRMNATLGVEVPFTNFNTQTTIPYGYVDPPTEVFQDGETQLWKITHNGVDTHFIHFHLFTVQVINRVGWDGAIKGPDPYETGLKDTVRMNPLEDIIVALRPNKPTVPWDLPNSVRPLDVTMPVGSSAPNEFANIDPTNQPATVTNDMTNFGWEYVWHCHILGHEENDMMRPMIFAVPPNAPTMQPIGTGGVVTWTDNSLNETGFTVWTATTLTGTWTVAGTVAAAPGTGTTVTWKGAKKGNFYRVVANNVVGYTKTFAAPAVGWPSVSADSMPSAAMQY